MKPDIYTIRTLDEICYHLIKYRKVTEPWQADFYDVDDTFLGSFESDEETMERIQDDSETFAMVTEFMDFAMMMGTDFSI